MKILGIDPGLKKIAFTITQFQNNQHEILSIGILKNKNKDKKKIFKKIYKQIKKIINIYKPNIILYESIFIYKNLHSITNIIKIQGILNSLSYLFNIPIQEINPTTIKKHIIKGNANKIEIKNKIIKKFQKLFLKINKKIFKDIEFDIYDSISVNITFTDLKNNQL